MRVRSASLSSAASSTATHSSSSSRNSHRRRYAPRNASASARRKDYRHSPSASRHYSREKASHRRSRDIRPHRGRGRSYFFERRRYSKRDYDAESRGKRSDSVHQDRVEPVNRRSSRTFSAESEKSRDTLHNSSRYGKRVGYRSKKQYTSNSKSSLDSSSLDGSARSYSAAQNLFNNVRIRNSRDAGVGVYSPPRKHFSDIAKHSKTSGRFPMGPNCTKEQWGEYLDWLEARDRQRSEVELDISKIYRQSPSLSPVGWKADTDKKSELMQYTKEEKEREIAWKKKLKKIIRQGGLEVAGNPDNGGKDRNAKDLKHHKQDKAGTSVRDTSDAWEEEDRGIAHSSSSNEMTDAEQNEVFPHVKNSKKKDNRKSFCPSKHFNGRKEGYVYKLDELGLGYYLDTENTDALQEKLSTKKKKVKRKHKSKSKRKDKKISKRSKKRHNSSKKMDSKRRRKHYSSSSSDSSSDASSTSSQLDSVASLSKRDLSPTHEASAKDRATATVPTMDITEDTEVGNLQESSDDDLPGPQPLGITVKLSNKIVDYGGALRPGEGEAIAQYVQEGKRIPRRGEVGLNAEEIEKFEDLGYVMSGSRHRRMNAIRIRKENQVYSAEEQRALAMYNYEERANREGTLITDLREMLKKQNETIFTEIIEEKQTLNEDQKAAA